jgi:predicted  nucleic acid-binding Zn-ribbon protein
MVDVSWVTIALPVLSLVLTLTLGYKAIHQKAEDHDLQTLKTVTDYRVQGLQHESDRQREELREVQAGLKACLQEQIKWHEERTDLLLQLLEARTTIQELQRRYPLRGDG